MKGENFPKMDIAAQFYAKEALTNQTNLSRALYESHIVR